VPDWRRLVEENWRSAGRDPDREAEIVEELAAHLEDRCADEIDHGIAAVRAETAARAEAALLVGSAARIVRAKEGRMTARVRTVWLPAVATALVAEVGLYLVIRAGVRPWTILLDWHVFHAHHPLLFYVPWLLALPVVGAAGAAWARGQGATLRDTVLVSLFPAISALGLAVPATILDLVVDVAGGHHSIEHTLCGAAWIVVSFVLAPALALGLGLLVATATRRRSSQELGSLAS
jgi:hypothetical protein